MNNRTQFAKKSDKMSIKHRFYKYNWVNGFKTENGILHSKYYEPEILFVGTFNPDIAGNSADMFYGRNFFWPGFKNLFVQNGVVFRSRREQMKPFHPSLKEIFDICRYLKLGFADLVEEAIYTSSAYSIIPPTKVLYKNKVFDLIADKDLLELDYFKQIRWNTDKIISFLCSNKSIRSIYFTRQPTAIWLSHWNKIKVHHCSKGISFYNIYTPSGRRLKKDVMTNLLHRWVHPVSTKYQPLDNNWLLSNGVNLGNF